MSKGIFWLSIAIALFVLTTSVIEGLDDETEPSKSLRIEVLGPGKQKWDHITVRPGVHLFYWLYFTTAKGITNHYDRPLVIWLQGGPGMSSTGFGNFREIGPRTSTGELRNETWVDDCNILFIDSPVGSGFSYADSDDLLVTKDEEITRDLMSFLKIFLDQHPKFKTVDVYIFGESYGGKVIVNFAWAIHEEMLRGQLKCTLVALGLGSPWISPIDALQSYPDFLYNTGLIAKEQAVKLEQYVKSLVNAVTKGDYIDANKVTLGILALVTQFTAHQVDFYNIYKNNPYSIYDPEFELFMNTIVYKMLKLNCEISLWQNVDLVVHKKLGPELMRPAINIVERILNETNINIMVYTGQFDLIVPTPGTESWINKLEFRDKAQYTNSARTPIKVDGIVEGFCKKSKRLSFCWIRRAGHSAPMDNPKAGKYVLQSVLWPGE